jgi:type II secretory pathway component PulM
MIWKPWHRRTEHAREELREAQRAQQKVVEELVPETKVAVGKVFGVKHENHLGETFDVAFRGGRAV